MNNRHGDGSVQTLTKAISLHLRHANQKELIFLKYKSKREVFAELQNT